MTKHQEYRMHLGSALVVLALVVLAIGSTGSGSGGGGGGGTSSPRTPDKIDAWVMAQQFVKDNLRSPSTADFGDIYGDYQNPDDVVTALGGGKFRVRAWVDAQNSFGATIRNRFDCELEYLGNDRWLIHLEFSQ